MKINPNTFTITQLYGTESEQYVIPAYQRRYSWEDKHIRELFDDINQLDDGDAHLLGSIVCLTSTFKAGINELELVDGQQRSTTIMLFLNAMEERLLAAGKRDDALNVERCLYCKDFAGIKKNKLRMGDLDQKDFDRVMQNRNLDDVVNDQLLRAHQLVMRLVGELNDEEFNRFRYKFINNAYLIRLDVSDAKDAFKLFETINNRGLALSPADIIKNFLLGNASLINDGTLEDVKESWTGLVLALDGISMDDFFRQYMISLRGRRVTKSQLIDSFKKYYVRNVAEGARLQKYEEFVDTEDDETAPEQQHLTDFVGDLRKAAEVYRQIVRCDTADEKINRHLDNLRRIRSFAANPFVLNLLRRDIDRKDMLAILKMLETFVLRRNVAEYRTNELEDIFARLTKLPDERLIENVYVEFRDSLPSDDEFRARLLTHDFKGQLENRAKYMLEQLEYKITGDNPDKPEKPIGSSEDVHLEHIMPQTITTKKSKEEFGDWEAYLGEDRERHGQYVARLGNLTLLGAPLNIHASNNPFKSKKVNGVAADGDKSKETDYSKSKIELTRQLLDLVAFRITQIESRSNQLSDLAMEIWKLPELDVDETAAAATREAGSVAVTCVSGDTEAHGQWFADDDRLIVIKGSTAALNNHESFRDHNYRKLKDKLLADGILTKNGDELVFAEDYTFDSPSAAAAVVLARSAAGPREWRNARNRTILQMKESN
ncbi:MAG TPA: DUF4357 domain-containing protein [Candidatus Saccharimonadales bacterium]|nr:DUF4357 domain-containing protein [Candidatus Saccharimonadales bacterium]